MVDKNVYRSLSDHFLIFTPGRLLGLSRAVERKSGHGVKIMRKNGARGENDMGLE